MLFRRRREDTQEAQRAVEEATKKLHEVKKRGKEVSAVSKALREIRERNHFADQMEEIFVHYGGSP